MASFHISPTQGIPHTGWCSHHPPVYIHTQDPCFSPLCRPESPAHTKTGGGGSPVPGPASRMAGHLHCTSCTKRPLLTGTGRRCQRGQCGALGVGNGQIIQQKWSDALGRSIRTSGRKSSETTAEDGGFSLVVQTLTPCKSDPVRKCGFHKQR